MIPSRLQLSKTVLACVFFWFTTTSQAADEVTTVTLPVGEVIDLKFAAVSPKGAEIDASLILAALAHELQKASKMPLRKSAPRNSAGDEVVTAVGMRASLNHKEKKLIVQYVNIDLRTHIRGQKSEHGPTLTVPISFDVQRESDFMTIRLTPPHDAILHPGDVVSQMFSRKLRPTDDMLADFVSIFGSLPQSKLTFFEAFKGEVNTTFKPESTLANFERILGRYVSRGPDATIYDVKRDNLFSYRVDQQLIVLKLAVFPYRDGTKIAYEASLPYTLGANGYKFSYDLPDRFKVGVEKIAND